MPSILLHCNSQAVIHIAKNKAYNGKSRHIRLKHHVVCSLIKFGASSLKYARLEINLADPLAKGLDRKLVSKTAKGMGLNTPM